MNLAWHYVRLVDGKPVLRDGRRVPPVGEWLVEEGPLRICERGLHGSWRALDALQYCEWGNAAACLVEVDGIAEEQADKFVCARRRVLGWVTCDDLLRLFAREAALSVAQHWMMPPIVRDYLETGREEIRDAAGDAYAAADAAARAAAYAAADAAAGAAARAAARADLNALLESILIAAIGPEAPL